MPHIKDLRNAKRVYLIGIGGTAMASLAGMLKERGAQVGGSDEHLYPPMSTFLERLGIAVLEGYTKEHLETFRPDLVIIGNAAAITNPEAAAALEMDLPYTSMPEAIFEFFIKGKHSIVVTGTHGKTTTTSIMAWVLESAGKEPSLVVGGIPLNFNQNYKLGGGEHFVIEGDEYNTAFFDKGPKFLHYHANSLLVNNIEFDHADIYENLEAIVSSFRAAIRQVVANDVIVANGDDPQVAALKGEARARWFTYGLDPSRELYATDIDERPEGTRFTVWLDGREWHRFETTQWGRHNVLNSLSVIATAHHLGLSPEAIDAGLRSFLGVKRRMEVRGVAQGVTVVDDFAHHPTAILTTLRGAKKRFPNARIWALFEPRSISSARKSFEEGYVQAFREADRVIVGPIFHQERYRTRYGIDKMMSVPNILDALRRAGIEGEQIEDFDEIARRVAAEAREGDVVILMSSGAFGGAHEAILRALANSKE